MEHERCDQCHFDGGAYSNAALLHEVRSLGPRWRAQLADAGAELRTRPAPDVWSTLEYAAHSRDITALHVFGVEQALTIDEPAIPDVDPGLVDEVAGGYANEDPDAVLDALEAHADRLAELADNGGDAGWERGLTIGTERRTVRQLVEHALHDSVHHLDDVERGLTQLRARR